MGGFILKGPSKCFVNKQQSGRSCRCIGFNGEIDIQTEQLLLHKEDRVLVMAELPGCLREKLEKAHLGPTLEYYITDPPSPLPSAYDSMQYKLDSLKRERARLNAVTDE